MRPALSLLKKKTIWGPTQEIEWLGISWNAKEGVISINEKRVAKAERLLQNAIVCPIKSARELARLVGSIISMSPVLGRLTRIMSRHCQMSVAAAEHWDREFALDAYCLSEIQFWSENLREVNKNFCFIPREHNKIIYSDASKYACGALVKGEAQLVCHKLFTAAEAGTSSTQRELITILYSLQAFGANLFTSRIKWFTDNQATAKIVDVGSMKFILQDLAYKIFSHCLAHDIDLCIEWIPRALNAQADFVSKIRDCDDWQISYEFFQLLDNMWGPHTVDCFASFYNAKTDRFFSRFWNPGTAAVDALFQSWTGENCLLVPPVSIVTRVLEYMANQRAVGTLVVPSWPSAVFWPLLWYVLYVALHEVYNFTSGLLLKYIYKISRV